MCDCVSLRHCWDLLPGLSLDPYFLVVTESAIKSDYIGSYFTLIAVNYAAIDFHNYNEQVWKVLNACKEENSPNWNWTPSRIGLLSVCFSLPKCLVIAVVGSVETFHLFYLSQHLICLGFSEFDLFNVFNDFPLKCREYERESLNRPKLDWARANR